MATKIVQPKEAQRKSPTLDFERKAFYAPAEIARILGISTQTVLDRIHDGSLYGFRLSPRIYRVPLAGFVQFLGEPPRVERVTKKLRRLPTWKRELAAEERRS